jgi:hypothetical protein
MARRLLYPGFATHHIPRTAMPTDIMETIDRDALAQVAGGRSTSRSGSDDQLMAALQQITSSIKDLAGSRNQSDPTQMLIMMMMMNGMNGGGGGGYAAPAVAAGGPPVINVDTSVLGRSGGGGGGCFPCGCKCW